VGLWLPIILVSSVFKYRGWVVVFVHGWFSLLGVGLLVHHWLFVGFFCSCYFLSKCLSLAVVFNFKSNKFNSWNQNTTGKSRGSGAYWEILD
jgi:hypothetical protein